MKIHNHRISILIQEMNKNYYKRHLIHEINIQRSGNYIRCPCVTIPRLGIGRSLRILEHRQTSHWIRLYIIRDCLKRMANAEGLRAQELTMSGTQFLENCHGGPKRFSATGIHRVTSTKTCFSLGCQ